MTGYQTGDDNRLTNDGTYTYEYDDEGNRTRRTKTSTGEVTEYEWDYRNRLVKVTEKNSQGTTTQVVEYTYDVFNRRIAKEVDTSSPFDMADAAIERYVYDDIHNSLASLDGGNVVLDFVDPDGSGAQSMALSKRYLYGQAVDQILAQEDVTKDLSATDRVLWPLVDNLGTVRDLAKQDGTIAAHFMYDSFGNVTSGDTSMTRYLFTSREFDTDTDLQYNRARWYDAEVGRWISEDPLGFVAGDANVARYVGNGPDIYVDPTGLFEKGWPPPPEKWGGTPSRWPCARPRHSSSLYDPGYWPTYRTWRVPRLDSFGLPVGIGTWPVKDFLYGSMIPAELITQFGCGGLFAMRAGLYPNAPLSWVKVKDARAFTDLKDALEYLKDKGGALGGIERKEKNWPFPEGWQGTLAGVPSEDERLLLGSNYAVLIGTTDDWYWEMGDHAPVENVIHTRTPLSNAIYVVVPNAPTNSPLISPDDLLDTGY